MKVTIEYDGNEEQEEIQVALDGYKWKNAIRELDQRLRETTKYGRSILSNDGNSTEMEREVAEKLREFIRETLTDYNLNLEL
jgi:hypothetical protein